MKNKQTISQAAQWLIFLFPILLLTIQGGMSLSFFLLVAISIYALFQAGSSQVRKEMDRDAVLFSIAMSATIISILLTQLYHLEGGARHYDSASRFLFAIPIFLVLRSMPTNVVSSLQYGLPIGAILIALSIWWSGQTMTAKTDFLIHIHLGDLALMLGFLSIFSLNWTQKDTRYMIALKTCGLVAGLYVSLLAGARGGWAAIPAFILIWIVLSTHSKRTLAIRMMIFIAAICAATALLYAFVDIIQIRLNAAINDLTTANPDTSLGIRFQLWGAAFHLFMEQPLLGAGANGFGSAMNGMADAGMISREAAEIGKGEVHSYYFAVLARYGIVGVVSVLCLFCLPLWMFARAAKSSSRFHQVAARMGLVLVSGFIVYCLTVEIFNLKMVATFYAVSVAVLLAAATNRRVNETQS